MREKRKIPFGERLSRFFELPRDVVETVPVLILRGTGEVEVDGCVGILSYGAERVLLGMKKGAAEILGRELTVSDFCGDSLTVRGEILSARLTGGRDARTGA